MSEGASVVPEVPTVKEAGLHDIWICRTRRRLKGRLSQRRIEQAQSVTLWEARWLDQSMKIRTHTSSDGGERLQNSTGTEKGLRW